MADSYVATAALCEALLPAPDALDTPGWEAWEVTHIVVHNALHRIVDELRDAPELVEALVEAVAA